MKNLAIHLIDLLRHRQETLCVAESCTGGGLANEITAHAGVSAVFLGSVTTYANSAKISILDVDEATLHKYGAVSKDVAMVMAKNARKLFNSDWALSTTGIAGPSGGSNDKPVGLVWIGLCGPKILLAEQFFYERVSRLQHRKMTSEQALMMLLHALTTKN